MKTIAARKTTAQRVTLDQARLFIEENHRQGFPKTKIASVSVGLLYEDEIVGIATFCSPRTDSMRRKYSSELLRLAFKENFRIIGGASKLIKFYIDEFSPPDFFTYQDTSGEATAVYEHAGMTLVSQAKKKQYLVAPGKTLETGSRKEVLGMAYATRYGPDRILGTKLGEVFREDGTRKSNKDIFLEELGWHIEETSGDRVYEWVNPNRTYYTYKITASDSDKYYYGVRHLKKANASLEDCLNDGYFGSGGAGKQNKFFNWKEKHRTKLKKEIITIHDRAQDAYQEEMKLIGDSFKTDPLCLNSTRGGLDGGIAAQVIKTIFGKAFCEKCQKETSHRNLICLNCNQRLYRSMKWCENCQEERQHLGNSCYKCLSSRIFSSKKCELCEKVTVHRGNRCTQCSNRKTVKLIWCEVCKKKTNHQGSSCSTCVSRELVSLKECKVHGLVKHQGNTCSFCNSQKSVVLKYCGSCEKSTKHQGDKCNTCLNKLRIHESFCELCGKVTKHNGGSCYICSSKPQLKFCPVCQKDRLHNGNSCAKCAGASLIKFKQCNTCKTATKHRGEQCLPCQAAAAYYPCEPCGGKVTRHKRGGTCYLCERREKKRLLKISMSSSESNKTVL